MPKRFFTRLFRSALFSIILASSILHPILVKVVLKNPAVKTMEAKVIIGCVLRTPFLMAWTKAMGVRSPVKV